MTTPEAIPNKAVEAAARAMFASEQCDLRQKQDLEVNWIGRLSDHDRDEYRRLTTAALSAAAPLLQAQALSDAANMAFKDKKIQGLQRVLIGNWLRARAAELEGGKP